MWRASGTGHVSMPLHKGHPSPSTVAPGSGSLCPGSGQQEGTERSGSLLAAYFLEHHGLAICTCGMFMSQGYLTLEGACNVVPKMENSEDTAEKTKGIWVWRRTPSTIQVIGNIQC